jgi:hypothetical protein
LGKYGINVIEGQAIVMINNKIAHCTLATLAVLIKVIVSQIK